MVCVVGVDMGCDGAGRVWKIGFHDCACKVAFSGGAEDLQNPLGLWNVIARVWPSGMQSLGLVFLSMGIGSSSLSQLAVLLIIPTVLTCGAQGRYTTGKRQLATGNHQRAYIYTYVYIYIYIKRNQLTYSWGGHGQMNKLRTIHPSKQ